MKLPAKIDVENLTFVVDTREQIQFDFSPNEAIRATLETGDYSAVGLEKIAVVERKSLSDFVACCGAERDRFQRELNRLKGFSNSLIVIEATWSDLSSENWRSKLTAKQVQASACSWMSQGHILAFAGSHEEAAKITKSFLFYVARYRFKEAKDLLKELAQ